VFVNLGKWKKGGRDLRELTIRGTIILLTHSPSLPSLPPSLPPSPFPPTGTLSTPRRLLAGLGAGITEAILIVTPFDVVKVRLQAQHGLDKSLLQYQGPVDAARKIISQEGVGALWSGVTPTIYRNGIQQASMFYLKQMIDEEVWGLNEGGKAKEGGEKKKLAVWQSMASGFMASCPGLVMTNPFDIVKVRVRL